MFLRPDPYRESLRLRGDVKPGVQRPRIRDGIEHLKNRPRAVLGIGAVAVGHVRHDDHQPRPRGACDEPLTAVDNEVVAHRDCRGLQRWIGAGPARFGHREA